MLVRYNKARILGYGEHLLKPGVNDIPAEVVAAMQDDHIMAAKFDSGEIEHIDTGPKKKTPTGEPPTTGERLAGMDKSEAVSLIEKTADLSILQDWFKADKRKVVRDALRLQVKKIKNPTFRDGGGNDEEELSGKDED